MMQFDIPLVPGPVAVPQAVLAARNHDYASPDLDPDFVALYRETQVRLRQIMGTENEIVIALGEAMVVLWGGLKSIVDERDRVLCISSGLFGAGFASMARTIGADTSLIAAPSNRVPDPETFARAARQYQPTVVTMVHCETPSGTLTPVEAVGRRLRDVAPDALFVVDAVASVGGAPLHTDDAGIDLCLVGTQKCLSAPPDLGIVSVSERAWARVEERGYEGYDALQPFRWATRDHYFPYTHSWQAVAGLHATCGLLLQEGLRTSYARHAEVARSWRDTIRTRDLELFAEREEDCSPTVTAVRVPGGVQWDDLDRELRANGMLVGGNYGDLRGKVFRIGHMGTQATMDLVDRGSAALAAALERLGR